MTNEEKIQEIEKLNKGIERLEARKQLLIMQRERLAFNLIEKEDKQKGEKKGFLRGLFK